MVLVKGKGNKMSILKHRKTIRRIIFSLALLPLVLFTSSCAIVIAKHVFNGPANLAGTQKDANYQGAECRNILIIGLIENSFLRVGVENGFIDRFTQPGLRPIVGSIIIPDLAQLKDRTNVDRLFQKEQIDKIITIEVEDVPDKDMPEWLRIWMAAPLAKGDLTGVTASRNVAKNARFEIGLWDAKTLKREWRGTTDPGESFDILKHVHDAAASTVHTLIKEKIIRPAT
jgi:hypothetical protein